VDDDGHSLLPVRLRGTLYRDICVIRTTPVSASLLDANERLKKSGDWVREHFAVVVTQRFDVVSY